MPPAVSKKLYTVYLCHNLIHSWQASSEFTWQSCHKSTSFVCCTLSSWSLNATKKSCLKCRWTADIFLLTMPLYYIHKCMYVCMSACRHLPALSHPCHFTASLTLQCLNTHFKCAFLTFFLQTFFHTRPLGVTLFTATIFIFIVAAKLAVPACVYTAFVL